MYSVPAVEIRDVLKQIEQDKKVKILFAIESGSRAWGIPSPDSDWDIRFVYCHPVDWYLSIFDGGRKSRKDTIDFTHDKDLDFHGWDIRKALWLFNKGNAAIFEWIKSPIVYYEHTTDDTGLLRQLRKCAMEYYLPKEICYHYIHMARGNYERYLTEDVVRIKKYFYVLRPILTAYWITHYWEEREPPIDFNDLLDLEILSKRTRKDIGELLDKKRVTSEIGFGERIESVDNFLVSAFNFFDDYVFRTEPKDMRRYEKRVAFLDQMFKNYITTEDTYV